jgi:Kdo2-lipid IVA lauroyltransferase/acyltransferase
MKLVLWFFQFLLVVFLSLPVALIPYKISLKFGEMLGRLLFFSWVSRRKIAVDNLTAAVSRGALVIDTTPEAVIKQNFKNFGKSLVEDLKIYYGFGDHIIRNVEIEGVENFRKAHEKGAGVIILMGHCGNWELTALALSVRVTKLKAVARALDNPFLNKLVERTREKFGNKVIYKRGALRKILTSLRKNEAVVILMDQSVISSEGVIAEFLGKKDYTLKTPALIAMKTGCSVVPVFIKRVNGGHRITIGEEIDLDRTEISDQAVHRNTVRLSGYIEEYVRQNPSEWLWIHRRWKRIKD